MRVRWRCGGGLFCTSRRQWFRGPKRLAPVPHSPIKRLFEHLVWQPRVARLLDNQPGLWVEFLCVHCVVSHPVGCGLSFGFAVCSFPLVGAWWFVVCLSFSWAFLVCPSIWHLIWLKRLQFLGACVPAIQKHSGPEVGGEVTHFCCRSWLTRVQTFFDKKLAKQVAASEARWESTPLFPAVHLSTVPDVYHDLW